MSDGSGMRGHATRWWRVAALSVVAMVVAALGPTPSATARPAPINGDGAWTIYMDPKVYETATATYVGSTRRNGDIEMVRLARGTMAMQHAVLEQRRGPMDDHMSPAILEALDGRMAFFWSGHNRPAPHPIRYRVTGTSGSLNTLSAPRVLRGSGIESRLSTYAQVVRLRGETRPYVLVTRLDDLNWHMTTSADLVTWSKAVQLTKDPLPNPPGSDGQPHFRPYVEIASDGWRTAHIGITTGESADRRINTLHHVQLRNGELLDASGKRLRSAWQVARMRPATALDPREGTPVTPPGADARVQVFDMSVVDGRPTLASSTTFGVGSHTVDVSFLSGGTWTRSVVVETGRRPQSIALDQRTAGVVYAATVEAGASGNPTSLRRWTRTGSGWTSQVVHDGGAEVWSPASPSGAPPSSMPELFWLNGSKQAFNRFNLGVVANVTGRAPIWLTSSAAHSTTRTTRVTATATQGIRGPGAAGVQVRLRTKGPKDSAWRDQGIRRSAADGRVVYSLPRLPAGTQVRVDTVRDANWGYALAPTRTL